MKKTFTYFQPEYVKNFQCDGQYCKAHCCRYWFIEIDNKTYKKYSHIKPKSAAKEITKHLLKVEERNCYMVKLDESGSCPMLTEDNWCKIQRTYGEEFLSPTCVAYPRISKSFGDFFERSLSLTCPVVAKLVLNQTEPLKFEYLEVTKKIHDNIGRIGIGGTFVPQNMLKIFPKTQMSAVSILQNRNFSINQRLIILGFFLDKFDEIVGTFEKDSVKLEEEILKLVSVYKDEDFLNRQVPMFLENISFNLKEHLRLVMEIFETIHGEDRGVYGSNRKFVHDLIYTLDLEVDEGNQISLNHIVKKYQEIDDFRKKYLEKFSTVFENYLVNEFFLNIQPYRFSASIVHNYGVFVITYKMLELLAVSVAVDFLKKENLQNANLDSDSVNPATFIGKFASNVDHSQSYLQKVFENLDGKENMMEIIQIMLDSQN